MPLDLVSVAHNRPRLIREQIRLLHKYLKDEFTLTVLDNSTDADASDEIKKAALDSLGVRWERPALPQRMHHEALNHAARRFHEQGSDYFGFLDHDIFPTRETQIVSHLQEFGFLGIGQRTPASGKLYPWPGWCFFSAEWAAGRELDFTGRDGADTGSGLWPLFAEGDWRAFYRVGHGYGALREPDDVGLQSWGYEQFATERDGPFDWIHFSNGCGWMVVPSPEERERLIFEMLEAL